MTEAEWLAKLMAKGRVRRNEELGCWEWLGAVSKWGYGRLTVEKRWWAAHRYAYATFIGEIPDGLMVLHQCDNPPCVNPAHLFLGTHDDNMRDMKNKQRSPKGPLPGEANSNAVLTESLIREGRELAKKVGVRAASRAMSAQTGISADTFRGAIRGKWWKHI